MDLPTVVVNQLIRGGEQGDIADGGLTVVLGPMLPGPLFRVTLELSPQAIALIPELAYSDEVTLTLATP